MVEGRFGKLLQLNQGGGLARRKQSPADLEQNLVCGPEESFKGHYAFQEEMECMFGREADAGEHLLAVPGNDPRVSRGEGLGEGRRLIIRFITRGN